MISSANSEKHPILSSRTAISFIAGLATAGALFLALRQGSEAQVQREEVRKITWNVTAAMQDPFNPQGKPSGYRLEDPEYKIVCYTRYSDLSGSFACVKR
jgi:hypothetical protein